MLENLIFRNTFSHSLPVTCFTFLISVKDVIILSILDSILKLFHMFGLDTNPDWLNLDQHALVTDPDPPKWCGSDPIRIHFLVTVYATHIFRCKSFNRRSWVFNSGLLGRGTQLIWKIEGKTVKLKWRHKFTVLFVIYFMSIQYVKVNKLEYNFRSEKIRKTPK